MATDTTKTPKPQDNLQTDFMSAIQDKLLGQSGIISSTNSKLETRLNNAISGVQESADTANKALNLDYGRQIGYAQDKFMSDQVEGRAAGAGGVINMAAYTALKDDTNKNLKDLEDRKQSLILQNDSAAASKIADLQFKALEFQQQAQQQTFSNLLGIANFGISSAQEKRLAETQTFQEKQAISNIALQYGLDVKPGDTIDTITSKAMVFASEEQKARLAKLQSEIKYTNAQTAHILAGDKEGATAPITSQVTAKLAQRWSELAATGQTVDTSAEMQNILGKYAKAGKEADFYDAVGKLATDNAKQQATAAKPAGQPHSLPQDAASVGKVIQNASASLLNYFTGGNTFEKI